MIAHAGTAIHVQAAGFVAGSPAYGVPRAAGIGTGRHRAGEGVSQDPLHVPDGELGRRLDDMALCFQVTDHLGRDTSLDPDFDRGAGLVEVGIRVEAQPRRFDRLLNAHTEVQNLEKHLELRLS